MKRLRRAIFSATAAVLILLMPAAARASIAYGSLNNFDCVNDTGFEAHGFDIELDDIHSKDISYTYDYNHYGVPKITEDLSDPLHPKVLIRYAATWNGSAWSAFTAIPSGPIAPTQGHQFTNPSVNFGGEHFGAGYYGVNPTAVRYFWLIDGGNGTLIRGAPVNVSTPTFTYNAAAGGAPANVVAVIVPPPPPVPPVNIQFGDATWVKAIKTTTHNANKVHLNDLVPDDEGQPQPWANGEPAEVETEWKLLQTEFANANNPKGILEGAPEDLPGGDEVITRRYEFYKYIGPIDAETGEAMADAVAADGIHGVGSVTYADHFDFGTGEWVTVTVDLSTIEVVGDFFGAQMAGFDAAPALGLIDHVQDGELNVAYPERTVVVPGSAPWLSSLKSGALPDGLTFDDVAGVLSGTPTSAGVFTFTIQAVDTAGADITKEYTLTIAGGAAVTSTIATSASPLAGGSTSGGGAFDDGTHITVIASHNPGYAFVSWTEGGNVVSNTAVYPFTVNGSRTLVANFVQTFDIATSAAPPAGGNTSGGGTFNSGVGVTVVATANPGYAFVNWTEGGNAVSAAASYSFNPTANRTLVANFVAVYTIATSSSPSAGGNTSGGGAFNSGASVTVIATANPGYVFVNWTEGGNAVSAAASYNFTASASRNLTANFAPALAIAASKLPDGEVGGDYNAQLVTGGVPHYDLTVTGNTIPAGLNFNHDTGVLSGVPVLSGKKPFTFSVRVTDQLGESVTRSFEIDIYPAVVIATKSLKSGKVGKAYSDRLAVKTSSSDYSCTWSLVAGSLAGSGLSLDPWSGIIYGMPAKAGTWNLTVQAADNMGGKPQKNLVLTIK
jgi:hypothetical protein